MVCPTLPLPPTSGGRKRSVRLLEAMERSGVRPHLLVLEAQEEGLREAARRGWEVDVVARPAAGGGARLRQLLRMEPEPHNGPLRARLAELARDAAFVQLEEVEQAQLIDALPRAVPVVVSLYNVDSELTRAMAREHPRCSAPAARLRFRAFRLAAVERRATRRADATLCVSDEDRLAFARRGARSTIVVPNGVDAELLDIPADGSDAGRVLFFGAHWWEPNRRGLERFVRESWPLVAAARPDARLRVVGPGPLDEARRAAAAADRVEIVGVVEDLAVELAAATVVVVPLWVGGGTRIKVVEAMAAARPVVGTSVGVERVGFIDGRHGLVRDSPDGLAAAVIDLLGDPVGAAAMGRAARDHVEPLRWESATVPAEVLYRRLAAEAT